MALAPVANDAPSESAEVPAPDPSPAEDQAQAMEVDDYAACPSLPSPVSCEDDDLLSGLPRSGAMEVESGLAHLSVSTPLRRHYPSHTMLMRRHFLRVPPTPRCERREATQPDEEGSVELTPGEDSKATLLQGFPS